MVELTPVYASFSFPVGWPGDIEYILLVPVFRSFWVC